MNTQNDNAISVTDVNDAQAIISLVLDGLSSVNSKRAYQKALIDFMAWYTEQGKPGLSKAIVQRYKNVLQTLGLSSSTINQRMSAIRKLAQEAADNGLVDQTIANGVARVGGVKSLGVRAGNWLTKGQAQALINTPDITTLKGLKDRAILAVMLGAGLRRSEVAELTFDHIQQRDGRWVIVDIVGKGNRVRTVPIPSWTKAAIDEWAQAAGIRQGNIFLPVHKGGWINGNSMTPQAIRNTVSQYAQMLGFDTAAHDLRRTYAKLAHRGGSPLEQIQLSLGHASIKTTEKYLGVQQNLADAPCDKLGLGL